MKNLSAVNFSFLLQGLFVAFMLMFVFSIILTILTVVSDWEESTVVLNLFNYLSIVTGAAYVGKRCLSKKWLNGLLVGAGYLLILTLLHSDQSIILHWVWVKQFLITAGIGVFGGVLGGIFSQ